MSSLVGIERSHWADGATTTGIVGGVGVRRGEGLWSHVEGGGSEDSLFRCRSKVRMMLSQLS